jgi:hypothetical protein
VVPIATGFPLACSSVLSPRATQRDLRRFDVQPARTLLIDSVVIALAALSAAGVPARRAATIDPLRALRVE